MLSQSPKALTEIQFELITLPIPELLHFGSTGLRSWPSHRLKEGSIAGRDFFGFRNSGSTEESLGSPESLLVERRNLQSERFDISVKPSVIDGAINHPIGFGGVRVEIIGAQDDFKRPGSSDQTRQPFNCPTARDNTDADFRLAEDGFLFARKAQVAGQDELVSNTPCATSYLGDADYGRFAEAQDEVDPRVAGRSAARSMLAAKRGVSP